MIHTHYHNVPIRQADDPQRYADQQKFFTALRQIPYFTLYLGRLVDRERTESCRGCGNRFQVLFRTEKGVDVHLAVQMLEHAFDNQYDTAILVSQDGDFVPAVEAVRRLHKRVENADFPTRLPSYLSKRCSSVTRLDEAFLRPHLR